MGNNAFDDYMEKWQEHYGDMSFSEVWEMENGKKMSEQVNHPSHYNTPGRKECIVEMEEQYGLGNTAIFCLMNAYKYLYRAGEKADNSQEQDINKARWYFNWVNEKIDCVDNLGYRGLMLYSDINKKLKLLKGDNEDEK
jgi:hypothetical protein